MHTYISTAYIYSFCITTDVYVTNIIEFQNLAIYVVKFVLYQNKATSKYDFKVSRLYQMENNENDLNISKD